MSDDFNTGGFGSTVVGLAEVGVIGHLGSKIIDKIPGGSSKSRGCCHHTKKKTIAKKKTTTKRRSKKR